MRSRPLEVLRMYVTIARSGLFDAAYYREQNPDLRWFAAAPLLHYVISGSRERRNPSPYFNVDFYLEEYPDVAATGLEPLHHYIVHGVSEGRNPSVRFNTRHYLSAYPDVALSGLHPLAHFLRHGRASGRRALPAGGPVQHHAGRGTPQGALRRLLLVASSHDPFTARYRVHQLIPHYTAAGIECFVADESLRPGDIEACDPDVVWLCRVAGSPSVRETLQFARDRGKVIVFDIDDLLLDPAQVGYLHFAVQGRIELYRDLTRVAGWYRQTLHMADAVTCSTSHLAAYASRYGRPVHVVPNNLGDEILARVRDQDEPAPTRTGCTIGYFSGTRTHQRDFQEAVPALLEILRTEPSARLLIVGMLDLDERFASFRERIERRPRLPYAEMFDLYGMIDINLAPLEPDNPFTACKSELKVFEAAAHGVPSIVSGVGATAAAIEHERTGLVAHSPDEWLAHLRLLVQNPEFRRQLGTHARREIVPRFLASTSASRALAVCEQALRRRNQPVPGTAADLPQVLFVSGGPPACRRYRCTHAQEQLRTAGIPADVFHLDEVREWSFLPPAKIIVLHRVPHDETVERFIAERRATGSCFIFDTDDLVFVPGIETHVHAYATMPPGERALYTQGLRRYRQTLELCDAGLASTPVIAEAMRALKDQVFVHANAPDTELLHRSRAAALSAPRRRDVVIGYHSGTNTHSADFSLVAGALSRLLLRHPNVRLRIVGALEVPELLTPFAARIDRCPLVHWRDLPRQIAATDINLAPLENNPFCAAKSDLKWFEAALVGVPTVASRVGEFAAHVRAMETGMLADTPDEWESCIEQLIKDPGLRRKLADAARREVMTRRNPESMGRRLREILLLLLASQRDRGGIALNWYLQAPFEGSGGYTNIFRFGTSLAAMGYRVRFLLERVAHFEGLSEADIVAYVRSHFSTGSIELIVGHDNPPPADVAIATGWPTAYVVSILPEVRRKMYFVQDFEADFYPDGSVNHARAMATYDLGFRMLTLGHQLAARLSRGNADRRVMPFDFAADHDLFRPQADRPERPIRVIFYARPETPRRGFSVGMAALENVHRRFGDQVRIALYGSRNLAEHSIPFPFENLGVLTPAELARAFAASHIGVSFSLSNFSLVPLEMMASGCAVVELKNDNTSAVLRDGDNAVLAEFQPDAVAAAISRLVEDHPLRARIAAAGLAYANLFTWDKSAQVMDEFIRSSLLESACLQPPVEPEDV